MNSSSKLRIALIISLALNIFVASALATSWLRHGRACFMVDNSMRHWRSSHMPGSRELQRTLPESDQQALSDARSAHQEQIRQRMRALRNARQAVADALRAEPFNQQRLDVAFATVRQRETEVAEAAQAMMSELAAHISAEGRSKMADQLQSGRMGRGAMGKDGPPLDKEQN